MNLGSMLDSSSHIMRIASLLLNPMVPAGDTLVATGTPFESPTWMNAQDNKPSEHPKA